MCGIWTEFIIEMKHHIYIFDEHSRSSIYGIGSYIRQLQSVFAGNREVELCVFVLCALDEEYKVEKSGNCQYVYIPLNKRKIISSEYYRHIRFILRENIIASSDKYFIFSYSQHVDLMKWMKSNYPNSLMYFVVHYQEWRFKSDIKHYQTIIQKGGAEDLLSEKDKSIYVKYLEEKYAYSVADNVICLSEDTYDILTSLYEC